ncbi:hypothetical protein KDH_01070 [Dictyobacter sp. S3.2.2.5]|uniref:Uncharacterized protein n=1 Tax=Dictyobacter halimunensis TaxID=3026934 RepID=A0ABQ6FGZ7_9CHLR|nr:hypothetical protein KDH_01070 [Dictyobacter sp. S3.2.2.5]
MEDSPQISDQKYLLHEQYKDSSSLQSRLQGMQQMGLDFTESYRWLFDHLPREP